MGDAPSGSKEAKEESTAEMGDDAYEACRPPIAERTSQGDRMP